MALVPFARPDFEGQVQEIITTQFQEQPVIDKYLRLWGEEVSEVFEAFRGLATERDIDSAVGAQLDVIGRIVGQERTIIGADLYNFFGFEGDVVASSFGSLYNPDLGGQWWSLGTPRGGDVVLTDALYRQLIKARIMRNTSRGTPEDMLKYIEFVFGTTAIFLTNSAGSAKIRVGRQLTNFEKSLFGYQFSFEKYPTYYSPKPLGVDIELVEASPLGTLGFVGTPRAKGMILLSDENPDGGVFGTALFEDDLPQPTLDWNFVDGSSLPTNLEFTRPSVANKVTSNLVLQPIGVNVPAVDYNILSGDALGMYIGNSATNILLQSERMWDTNTWTVGDALGGGNFASATESYDIPDVYGSTGPTTKFVITASGDIIYARQYLNVPAGDKYVSLFLFVPEQAGVINYTHVVDMQDSESGTASTSNVFGKWTRHVAKVVTFGGRSWVDFDMYVNGGYAPSGFYFYAMGAQISDSYEKIPYIKTTTAAATRAADLAKISGASFSQVFDENNWTAIFQARKSLMPVGTNPVYMTINNGTTQNQIRLTDENRNNVRLSVLNSGASVGELVLTVPDNFTIGLSYSEGILSVCQNGGEIQYINLTIAPTVNQLVLNGTAGKSINSHIGHLTLYNEAVNEAQLRSLTS